MQPHTPHDPGTAGCNPSLHCHLHNRDEPAVPAYVVCGECGHVFPSPLALWLDHARAAFRAYPGAVKWYGRRQAVAFVLYCLRSRPSRIYACPHCSHDL